MPIVFGSLIGTFVVLLIIRMLFSFLVQQGANAAKREAEAAVAREAAVAKIRAKDGPSAAERKAMKKAERQRRREEKEAKAREKAEREAEMAALAASSDDEQGDAKV